MFYSGMALAILVVLAYASHRENQKDQSGQGFEQDVATYSRHSRQDLRLIAYLLMAILFALGIIADRIH